MEQAVRVGHAGAITGWASLRWRGAAYFDGRTQGGKVLRPVPLLLSAGDNRGSSHASLSKAQLAFNERQCEAGVWCTSVARALFDEMRFDSLRGAIVSFDMCAAAGLVSREAFAEYLVHRQAWTGVPLVRDAMTLASDASRSPQESRMRLVWILDAGLGPPLCNVPVFDRSGRLLGVPDLLDPVAGLVGEYDGAHHKSSSQHRKDVVRAELFRDHGLEYVEVVGGELQDRCRVAGRILRARARARFASEEERKWTL